MKAKLPPRFWATAAALALPLLGAGAASAHHSFAMFALDKLETVNGTVKSFRWAMPHVWITAVVTRNGVQEEWGFEGHAPNLMARKGWRGDTLKPGDKVSILMHPMRDGSKAGSVVHVTLPNGQQLWNADSVSAP